MTKDANLYFEIGCGRCSLGNTPECKVVKWEKELALMREIILETGLTEECKWGSPCYTDHGKNVLMLSTFKDCAFISFFKGTLLADSAKLLVAAGENSNVARLFKVTSVDQIQQHRDTITAYIFESIDIERKGLEVKKKAVSEYPVPEELEEFFQQDPEFKSAFYNLTPGRQKGYLLHFNSAKQAKTRISRIEKHKENILAGIGFHD